MPPMPICWPNIFGFTSRRSKQSAASSTRKHLQPKPRRRGLLLSAQVPRDDKDLEALAPTLPYPIHIKPRTHAHRLRNDKGVVVRSAEQLIRQYRLFLDREQYRAARNPISPDANRPVLQQFVNVGGEGVLSITGFLDSDAAAFCEKKRHQGFSTFPACGGRDLLWFSPPNAALSNAVRRLCDALGYFGIFEARISAVEWNLGCHRL